MKRHQLIFHVATRRTQKTQYRTLWKVCQPVVLRHNPAQQKFCGFRWSILPGVTIAFKISPCSLTTMWSLKPKNQSTEVLPRVAKSLKTLFLEIRRLWQTLMLVESTKPTPVHWRSSCRTRARGVSRIPELVSGRTITKAVLQVYTQRYKPSGHPWWRIVGSLEVREMHYPKFSVHVLSKNTWNAR